MCRLWQSDIMPGKVFEMREKPYCYVSLRFLLRLHVMENVVVKCREDGFAVILPSNI